MALSPPFVVYVGKHADGLIMNDIRAWLDHRKIQPILFKDANRGGGFEITFGTEGEASLFEREFVPLIRSADLKA